MNLSEPQLSGPDLIRRLEGILHESGVQISNICIEITENAIANRDTRALAQLRKLKDRG